MSTATTPTVLRLADWQARAAAHRQHALGHTAPARMRRDRGQPHPILDFLSFQLSALPPHTPCQPSF